MKSRYFLIHLLSILVFGLISCSPDKTEDKSEQENPEEIEVEIRNVDKTIQKLKDIEELQVSGFIDILTDPNKKPLSGKILSKASCKSNFHQKEMDRETLLSATNSIPVLDILPSLVFTPTTQETRTVWCNFDIKIMDKTRQPISIKLLDVKIKNTDSYVNYTPAQFPRSKDDHVHKNDLTSVRIQLPIEKAEVETLCESGHAFNYFDDTEASLRNLFPESLFQINNLEKCRLLVRDEKTKQVWLSKSLYIQNRESNLIYSTQNNPIGDSTIDYNFGKLTELTLRNIGNTPSYFKIDFPSAQVRVKSVYHHKVAQTNQTPGERVLAARWDVDGEDIAKRGEHLGDHVYRLSPGQTMTIDLVLNDDLSCPSHFHHASANNNKSCSLEKVHLGNLFQIRRTPVIYESHFENFELDQWKTKELNPEGFSRKGNTYTLWAPDRTLDTTCPNVDTSKSPEQSVSVMNESMKNIFLCQ